MTEDRLRLRSTFDEAALRYHRARPRYPKALFKAITEFTGGGKLDVLEIGPATGVATEVLAGMGHRIVGIEFGGELAERARHNLRQFDDVSIQTASFDEWEPGEWGAFDLVAAATSWHWLDPATKYERAARHLKPGGTLAFWSALHVVPDGGDQFFAALQNVYDEIGESLPGDDVFPRPGELPDLSDEIAASGLFADVKVRHLDWEISYTAEEYIDLLDTFSGHIEMGPTKRERLDGEIRRRLAARADGMVRRHWGAALHLARSI